MAGLVPAIALLGPTWILISHIQDWRWFSGRDDSPWYPERAPLASKHAWRLGQRHRRGSSSARRLHVRRCASAQA